MSVPPAPISKQPSLRDDAMNIIRRLRENGHIAYLAGGCVRDELLGLTAKDFDVATDAPPERVQQLFAKTQAVGVAFGVILVRSGKSVIEVATFRTDGSYSDGRRPDSVTFATAEADAQRRDFTINGLFLDPIENQVIDYVGGQADLRARLLRAIGDPQHRFAEDYLRMLRAVRFAARFDLTIEPGTQSAIAMHATRLIEISPERIADELRGMLTPPSRVRAWRQLWSLDLIGNIFRFLGPPPPVVDERARVFDEVAPGDACSFALALACAAMAYEWQRLSTDLISLLRSDLSERVGRASRKALRISNDELESVQAILRLSRDILGQPRRVAAIKRFLAAADSADSIQLLRAVTRVPHHDWSEIEDALRAIGPYIGTEVAPPPYVTGDDLVTAGLQPGPRFKKILDRTYDEQLEGRATDRAQALRFALEMQ